MFEHFLNLAIKAIFVENIALAFFLGMCSFLAVSKRVSTAIGLGSAVIFVLAITVPLNNLLFRYILREGALGRFSPALAEYDLSFERPRCATPTCVATPTGAANGLAAPRRCS